MQSSPLGEVSENARESVRRVFPQAERIDRIALRVSAREVDSVAALCRQRWTGDSVDVLLPVENGAIAGYAVIDNVKGKDQPITYLVSVTPDLAVKNVDILVYRESYGGEIGNSSWRKQFLHKTPGDGLRPGKEIRNITGATISARAVTFGVKKVLCLLYVLKARLPQTTGQDR